MIQQVSGYSARIQQRWFGLEQNFVVLSHSGVQGVAQAGYKRMSYLLLLD
jgi:hypothetical protein